MSRGHRRNMFNRINALEAPEISYTSSGEDISQQNRKSLHITSGTADARPHVLFIIDQLCEMGGAERVLLKIIRLLQAEGGFRCSLLTFKTSESFEEPGKIGCPLWVFPLKKTWDWNAVKVAAQIRKLIRTERISIAHTFFETSDLFGGLVSKLSGCPVLISSRRDMGILRTPKHRIAYKLMRRLYDAVLAVSPQVRDFCIQADGLDPARVQELVNGLEMEQIDRAPGRAVMRWQIAIHDSLPLIITVANIRRVKGIDVLVKAASLVHARYPQALFLVVGDGSEMEYCRELEDQVGLLGLSGNFWFLGAREDVFSLLKMSDVFCLPSRSEGSSNALLEAMACRLPCVATDVGGNRDAIRDGENGFIVPSEDWQAMGQRLIELVGDRELAADMGGKAEALVRSRFTADVMMKDLITLYNRLLLAKGR